MAIFRDLCEPYILCLFLIAWNLRVVINQSAWDTSRYPIYITHFLHNTGTSVTTLSGIIGGTTLLAVLLCVALMVLAALMVFRKTRKTNKQMPLSKGTPNYCIAICVYDIVSAKRHVTNVIKISRISKIK